VSIVFKPSTIEDHEHDEEVLATLAIDILSFVAQQNIALLSVWGLLPMCESAMDDLIDEGNQFHLRRVIEHMRMARDTTRANPKEMLAVIESAWDAIIADDDELSEN
jgi:hypothetical protein